MQPVVIGLNHQTAPIETRERVAFGHATLADALRAVCTGAVREAVILSTCNRVELYAAADDAAVAAEFLKLFLRRYHSLEQPLTKELYEHVHTDCVRHLFAVASGLDSMVVGETEILGQVKASYEAAVRAGTSGKLLNRLFQKAFQVAKHIRTHTQIGVGSVSVGSVAVDLAEKIFGSLSLKTVMVLGSGEMGEATARSLKERGVTSIIVSSRRPERVRQLADKLGARAMAYEGWEREFCLLDIIISAASAPHPILTRQKLAPLMKLRRNRPLFLIDIGVPRNIERAVDTLDNVYLYDIDDLQNIAGENLKQREREIAICQSIIAEKVKQFEKWMEENS
jgi:glutamyl-tRNA reductase